MSSHLSASLAALSLLASVAVAQKMPDPRDNSRVVQLHDAAKWVERASPGKQVWPDGLSNEDRGLRAAARFAQAFCVPPMQAEEDVSVVAHRYLIAVARPQQQAWIASWLKGLDALPADRIELQVEQFEMSEGYFARVVEPLLQTPVTNVPRSAEGATCLHALLKRKHIAAVREGLANDDEVIVGPTVTTSTRALDGATAQAGRKIPYVRDYDVKIGNSSFEAEPIHDVVFDGLAIDFVCGTFADGDIGVSLRVASSDVEQPIPEFETKIGSDKVVVELPAVVVRHDQWNVKIGESGYAVCVLGRPGSRLAFVVRAKFAKKPAPGIRLPK